MRQIAVVGCGYWGPNLVRNFRSLEGCVVKAVCDLDARRLPRISGLYPEVQTTTEIGRILSDDSIEAVAVCTPMSTHHSLAMMCLEAGKHVLVEKPMARSSAECLELMETAERLSRTLMVDHTFVYSPSVQHVREIVQTGELGDILTVSSRRLNLGLFQSETNAAWDLAPHDISILLRVLGEQPTALNCQGKAHLIPGVEDVATLSLYFESGAFATIHASWMDPRKVRETTIVGSRKMLVYDDTEIQDKIRIYDKRVDAPEHYDTFAEFHCSYHYGGMEAPFVKQVEPLKVECEHFLSCIDSGEQPLSSGEQGLAVVRVLEAASESLRRGGTRVRLTGAGDGVSRADQRKSA